MYRLESEWMFLLLPPLALLGGHDRFALSRWHKACGPVEKGTAQRAMGMMRMMRTTDCLRKSSSSITDRWARHRGGRDEAMTDTDQNASLHVAGNRVSFETRW